jgi:hypothetical protein
MDVEMIEDEMMMMNYEMAPVDDLMMKMTEQLVVLVEQHRLIVEEGVVEQVDLVVMVEDFVQVQF